MKTDLEIEELIVEEDRPEHIARHKVKIEEVLEIISGDFVFIQGKYQRWQVIGKTKKARYLSIFIGERPKKKIYGLMTARPASRKERKFYIEFIRQKGGEQHEKK